MYWLKAADSRQPLRAPIARPRKIMSKEAWATIMMPDGPDGLSSPFRHNDGRKKDASKLHKNSANIFPQAQLGKVFP